MIHMPKGKMRTEGCYVADNIEGPWTGGDVLCSDLGNWNSGVAQGGIVQDKEGNWFGILFQDHGALGRIPVLVPVVFGQDGYPKFEVKPDLAGNFGTIHIRCADLCGSIADKNDLVKDYFITRFYVELLNED